MKNYKIEVYIPITSLDIVLNKLKTLNIGVIGNYKNCLNWYKVNSTWEASDEAHPYLGKVGEVSNTEEYKIEFRCIESKLKDVVKGIKEVHPYEEVCINIIELYDI